MVKKHWAVNLLAKLHGTALLIFLLVLSACAVQNVPVESEPPSPKPEDPNVSPPPTFGGVEPPLNPYAPGKGDESMQRGEVFIDSTDILILESFPVQYQLQVEGSLPTPCHELRAVIGEPDSQNRIPVQLFSLVDPKSVCTQLLEPFQASIPLASYPGGRYTVLLNGEKAGEITP